MGFNALGCQADIIIREKHNPGSTTMKPEGISYFYFLFFNLNRLLLPPPPHPQHIPLPPLLPNILSRLSYVIVNLHARFSTRELCDDLQNRWCRSGCQTVANYP